MRDEVSILTTPNRATPGAQAPESFFLPPPTPETAADHEVVTAATGVVAVPATRDMTFLGRDGVTLRVRGRLLAFGTSQRDEHSHPVGLRAQSDRSTTDAEVHAASFAAKNERCSACRWFEVQIAEVDAELTDDCTCEATAGASGRVWPAADPAVHLDGCGLESPSGRYLVVTAGRSDVPGELDFRRAEFTDSPYEVVELLVQTRGEDGRRFLPQVSARALSQAANHDPELRAAYLAQVTRL